MKHLLIEKWVSFQKNILLNNKQSRELAIISLNILQQYDMHAQVLILVRYFFCSIQVFLIYYFIYILDGVCYQQGEKGLVIEWSTEVLLFDV